MLATVNRNRCCYAVRTNNAKQARKKNEKPKAKLTNRKAFA